MKMTGKEVLRGRQLLKSLAKAQFLKLTPSEPGLDIVA